MSTVLLERRRVRRSWPRRAYGWFQRHILPRSEFHLLGIAILTPLMTLSTIRSPEWAPISAFALILVAGGFLLRPFKLSLVYGLVAVALSYVQLYSSNDLDASGFRLSDLALGDRVNHGDVVVLVSTAILMWAVSTSRARLGLQGNFGDTMLVDLRDRLRLQGELPTLPEPWGVEKLLCPAFGDSFSGDFLVTASTHSGSRLEICLVDVSGKGAAAGTRALLLSGAFSGLLGAMPPQDFLRAANRYLLRQQWSEGFATAIHLELDLESGRFLVGSAGHPPAAHFCAATQSWELLDGGGPLLGVIPDAEYPAVSGTLDPGDGLMLYTDGLVETPGGDLDVGIERLLGHAQSMVRQDFRGSARRIVAQAAAGESDDRALVVIWRG